VQGIYREEFEITTNMLDILIDPLVRLLAVTVCIVLYQKAFIPLLCSENRSQYSIDNSAYIYLLEFVSFMSAFCLPAVFLARDLSQNSFGDKINLVSLLVFISFALICPFMLMFTNRDFTEFQKASKKVRNSNK
jgi:uncharacterized PurR-regulated membrane protein YhhQ (DUF165 family)